MVKVEAIAKFPIPTNKKEWMRFLGMTSFYRKLCLNLSSTVSQLTDLLQKKAKFDSTKTVMIHFAKLSLF
jgi:hypothetical protein